MIIKTDKDPGKRLQLHSRAGSTAISNRNGVINVVLLIASMAITAAMYLLLAIGIIK